jgi:hypothetical protein
MSTRTRRDQARIEFSAPSRYYVWPKKHRSSFPPNRASDMRSRRGSVTDAYPPPLRFQNRTADLCSTPDLQKFVSLPELTTKSSRLQSGLFKICSISKPAGTTAMNREARTLRRRRSCPARRPCGRRAGPTPSRRSAHRGFRSKPVLVAQLVTVRSSTATPTIGQSSSPRASSR